MQVSRIIFKMARYASHLVYETVHRRGALALSLILFFSILSNECTGQGSPCPVTAIVNPNGTITLNTPSSLTILNQCHDVNNTSFISNLYHVSCSGVADEYVLMVTDVGRVYHFQLPYQNSSYYGQWCGQMDWNSWYQANVKYVPHWQHPLYNIQCAHIRSNGDQCSRLSEQSFCWQHR